MAQQLALATVTFPPSFNSTPIVKKRDLIQLAHLINYEAFNIILFLLFIYSILPNNFNPSFWGQASYFRLGTRH